MLKKSRKDTLVEQAQDLVSDISDAIAPHVERAKDELGPRLADAKDNLGPKIADAKDQLAPRIAEARDQAAPYVESAREKFVKDVVPAVQQAVSDAKDQAGPVVEEAKRRGSLAADALKGEPVKKKGGKKKKFFLFAALAGAGAFVFKKLRGGDSEATNWQTSYAPKPAPAAPPAPPSPSAPMAGSHAADTPVDSSTSAGDPTGANPGETLADATEEPHPVTTPDAPAEDVDVAEVEDPKNS
jgi:hypothetical protein